MAEHKLIWPGPFWWICAGLFTLHQLTQRVLHWSIPLVDSYLDPLLCFPVLFGLFVVERRLVNGADYRLPIFDGVIMAGVLSLVFEWGFPKWSEQFFYDPLDFVAYAIGVTLFFLFYK
ncbi:MAG: hypothetical protein AAFP02_15490 [Bacteroidota bacterium]